MSKEPQAKLAEADIMLAEAARLNNSGQHGEAMKKAYHSSELVAVAYLSALTGQSLSPSDATYDLFAETIRESHRHQMVAQKIGEVVGKVCALREAYEPALLEETTPQDAQQMIILVKELLALVEML